MQFWLVFSLLLSTFISLSIQLPFSVDKAAEAVACSRNPQLHYCGEYRQDQYTQAFKQHPSKTVVLASRQRVVDVGPSKDKDQAACRELRAEYTKTCTRNPSKKSADEFCSAYENVCFDIPRGEPDQPVVRNDDASDEHIERQLSIGR
uniref:Secreted protein n=1 Tax=Ditylenchus dipsaci TaxID=166011 RepID=A0A915DTP8_9BILA